MKVQATYRHVIHVTRDVEIDDEVFTDWGEREAARGRNYDSNEDAAIAFLNTEDTEFHAEVFKDWRTDQPLPSDFELQYSDVIETVLPASQEGGEIK